MDKQHSGSSWLNDRCYLIFFLPVECKKQTDIVMAIPNSEDMTKNQFDAVKAFVDSVVDTLDITPLNVHLGVVTFSDTAVTELTIDQQYYGSEISDVVNGIQQNGSGSDVVAALQLARGSMFSIYGGVRQSVGKSMLLVVPQVPTGNSAQDIKRTAEELRSIGVRLVVVTVGADASQFAGVSSRPEYLLTVRDYDSLDSRVPEASLWICGGKTFSESRVRSAGSLGYA